MKSVIVTGANGFIGSMLIKKLLLENINVVAIDVSFCNDRLPDHSKLTKILSLPENIESVIKDIPRDDYDCFYHFAWQGVNGIDKSNALVQVQNIKTAIEYVNVAKELKCSKFLCSGTVAEQAIHSLKQLEVTSPGMLYGAAKYSAHILLETYCKSINQPFVWMQFSNIYGPTNKTGNLVSYTLGELRKGNIATFGPAKQPYDFIFINDLIEAIYRIGKLKEFKNFYFIGSGKPRILQDYLINIGRNFGREDLIKIGVRQDDGIKYNIQMFNNVDLVNDIGNYVNTAFDVGIKETISNF